MGFKINWWNNFHSLWTTPCNLGSLIFWLFQPETKPFSFSSLFRTCHMQWYEYYVDGLNIFEVSLTKNNKFNKCISKKVFHQVLCPFAPRGIEDKQVAVTLLELWPKMVKMANFWGCWSNWKRPCSKSYENLLIVVSDN